MSILGLDISNHQGNVDLAAARAAGRDFVVIKATQGVSFADPYLAVNRAKAHAAGMIVGLYQFADLDDAVADARWFLSHVGPLQPNEFLVLDEEVQQPNKVAWCTTWLQTVHAATGTWPLIYMNRSTAAGYNWAPVAANSALWLAQYDNSTAQPSVAGWPAVAMKQYSDAGSVLGVGGTCDVDVFYGTADQLLAYCTPGGTDVALTNADIGLLLNYPAYSGGPSVSQVLKNLDLAVADLHMWARGDLGRPTDSLSFIAQLVMGLQSQVAAAPGMTCQGNPQAVLTALGEKLATPATPA